MFTCLVFIIEKIIGYSLIGLFGYLLIAIGDILICVGLIGFTIEYNKNEHVIGWIGENKIIIGRKRK